MKIIVGLGNPTTKYNKTRHNVGFDTIEQLAKQQNINIKEGKYKGLLGKGVIAGEKVILVKPLTFMNLSGECVGSIVDFYKANPATDLLVIYDDISLEPGNLRIRAKGSAGGHNGMKNIIAHLGTEEFPRIKVGVGDKPINGDLISHVLGRFSPEDRVDVDHTIDKACEAVETWITKGIDQAMNDYNRKK